LKGWLYSTKDSNSVVAYDGWEELYNERHKGAPSVAAESAARADTIMTDHATVKGTTVEEAAMRQTIDANLANRSSVDGLVAKSEINIAAADGGASLEGDSPQTPQRLTISAKPLSMAGMLQPEGVVATASEPQGPEPEEQRLRRSAPAQGQGMGA